MGLLNCWFDLPVLLRAALGLVLIGISTFIFFAADRIWIWGWVIGAVFLLGCTAGKNKGGYNF